MTIIILIIKIIAWRDKKSVSLCNVRDCPVCYRHRFAGSITSAIATLLSARPSARAMVSAVNRCSSLGRCYCWACQSPGSASLRQANRAVRVALLIPLEARLSQCSGFQDTSELVLDAASQYKYLRDSVPQSSPRCITGYNELSKAPANSRPMLTTISHWSPAAIIFYTSVKQFSFSSFIHPHFFFTVSFFSFIKYHIVLSNSTN